jgi:hypothetical protein
VFVFFRALFGNAGLDSLSMRCGGILTWTVDGFVRDVTG